MPIWAFIVYAYHVMPILGILPIGMNVYYMHLCPYDAHIGINAHIGIVA